MGIFESFSSQTSESRTVTASLSPADYERLADCVAVMQARGCRNRAEFARQALVAACEDVENGVGGRAEVKRLADETDPDRDRYSARRKS